MGYIVKVTGQRVRPYGRKVWREIERGVVPDVSEARGYELAPFEATELVRTGDEPYIMVSEPTTCLFFHKIRAGGSARQIAPGKFVCQRHYKQVLTEANLTRKYKGLSYTNISFEKRE